MEELNKCGTLPHENGRSEFFNVTFTVSCRRFGKGFDSRITDRSAPENSTEFIHEFKDMSEREET